MLVRVVLIIQIIKLSRMHHGISNDNINQWPRLDTFPEALFTKNYNEFTMAGWNIKRVSSVRHELPKLSNINSRRKCLKYELLICC